MADFRSFLNNLEWVLLFRRPTTVVGVSRDTPGMYGQTLKKDRWKRWGKRRYRVKQFRSTALMSCCALSEIPNILPVYLLNMATRKVSSNDKWWMLEVNVNNAYLDWKRFIFMNYSSIWYKFYIPTKRQLLKSRTVVFSD